MKIENKKITILGAGVSGIGAAQLASHLGAIVFISDRHNISEIKDLPNKVKFEIGKHSNKCYDCDFAIISPGIDYNNTFIEKFKKLKIPILNEIEFAYMFTSGKIISITGSNGKSTVVKLLTKVLGHKYKNIFLGGNIGIAFSSNVLKELKNNFKNVIHILELSSFQLENINKFKSDISCFLNITEDHINRHKTFENYFTAKKKIIKNFTKESYFLYNEDDSLLKEEFKSNKLFTPYSISNSNNRIIINNSTIIDTIDNKEILNYTNSQLEGKHNLENIVAIIHIAKKLNVDNKIIRKSIIKFKPLEHRLEKLIFDDNVIYVNDSKATNIHSTICAINSSSNKTILILGGSIKSKIEYKKFLKSSLEMVKYIICYGEEGKNIYHSISDIFKSKYISDFKDAVHFAIKLKKPHYRILLSPACASFDQFDNFMERCKKFKEIVTSYYA